MTKKSNYEELEQRVLELEKEAAKLKKTYEALRESEEKYRKLIESIQEGIWVIDKDANTVFANSPLAEMLGYTEEEIIGKHLFEFMDEKGFENAKIKLKQRQKGVKEQHEFEFLRKDASKLYALIETAPIFDNEGHYSGAIASIMDISERRQAEVALEAERFKLRESFENLPLLAYNITFDGIIEDCNNVAVRTLGYESKDELIGKPLISTVYAPSSQEKSKRFLEKWKKKKKIRNEELQIITKQGEIIDVLLNVDTIFDHNGTLIYSLSTHLDITERKQAEEALRESRNMLEAVLDSIPSAVFWKDRDSIYLGGNRTWLEAAGLKSSEEVIGRSDYDLPWEKGQADSFREGDRMIMESGIPEYGIIEPYHRADGTRAWARTNKVPLRDKEGNITGILGTYEDITEQIQAEEEWQKLQAQLSNALEMAHLGHWEYDVASDLFTFNDHFYNIFRTTAKEVGGYTISSAEYARRFVHPDDIPVVAEEIRKAIESPDASFRQQLEHRMIYADGTVGYISVQFFIVRDAQGKTVKTYGVNQDITERKRTEEELREGERFLQDVFDSIKEGISVLDLNLKIVRVNSWMEEMYSKEGKLVGRKCYEVYQKKDTPCPWCPSLKTIETGEIHNAIVPYPSKENPTGWIDLSSFPLRNIEGNIVGVIEYVKDITQQKRAEEALRKSEEHYRSIFEDSRDAVYITTRNGKFIDANQSALDLFGYSREELASVNALQLYANPGDAGRFQKDIETKGFLRDYEITFRKKDGTEIDCLFNTTIRRANDGSILAYQGVIRDMTEQKKLEAQLLQAQKMESIGTMAGGIAHDFNNILGIIIGNTELAIDDVPEWNPAKGCLEEIRSASLRAKDVVRHILSFARKSVSERKPIQITSVIKDSLKLLRASIPTAIEIRQDFSCEYDTVLADPTQINQVLMNLCTNASHAMREEGGVLEVSLNNVDLESGNEVLDLGPGRYVKLSVSDTGPGIDSTTIDRIFDPYFTTKGLGEGTGMGLSVVHGIVKNHDGAVMVKSEPGKGAVFEVFFPLTEAAVEPEDKKAGALPTGNEKILFVDDEESLVKMAKRMLEMQGYQVETRSDPVEALELFRSKPDQFDLVITDMTMPNMTGDRLANEILSIRPDMPIILCSGFSAKIDAEKAKALGIRKYIEKPLIMSDFAVAVRKVLDKEKG